MNCTQIPQYFNLENDNAYQLWRQSKLNNYPCCASELVVAVDDPFHISEHEKQQMDFMLRKTNMVIYQIDADQYDEQMHKEIVKSMGKFFGLNRLDHNECADDDAITALQVNQEGNHRHYIPYSNKPINWHTDGYYNRLHEQIYAIILHCVRAAESGGENHLLDPEIVYILMRDKNPQWIRALSREDAMLIPKNVMDGQLIRPDRGGPVFMFDRSDYLHMRYTARKHNVIWRDDPEVQAAAAELRKIMQQSNPYVFRARLEPGQGLLARNVLHTRTAFDVGKSSRRLLYRARYYDAIG